MLALFDYIFTGVHLARFYKSSVTGCRLDN